jgi:integrase
VTLDRPDLSRHLSTIHKPRKVPFVLSPDEVARFLEAAPGIKYKAAFSVAYGAGLRVSEVASPKVPDIDSKRMMLRSNRARVARIPCDAQCRQARQGSPGLWMSAGLAERQRRPRPRVTRARRIKLRLGTE